jgi:stearoyl-CoA 9-desaturase NADPH oxidoreductase
MIAIQTSAARAAASVPVRLRAAGRATVSTVARRFALDRQIEFWLREIDSSWSLRDLRARVVEVKDETHDVKTFVLAPNRRWPGHRAGQFVTVEVEVDGVRMTRCYSLSSAPGDRYCAITVKRVAEGRVSSWLHDHLRRGDGLAIGQPAGDFVVPSPTPDKLLLLSGGSGVTPLMSILRDLAARKALQDVVFVHAARSARDVIFGAELEQQAARHPGLRVAVVLEDDAVLGGRIDAAKLFALVPDLEHRQTWLCGPPGMMNALSPIWISAGIPERLRVERFVPPALPAPATGTSPAQVALTLLRSRRRIEIDGTGTLLDQLERAGERPAYGCRLGICNTCRCRKRAGIVENALTGAVSSEGEEDIRLCVSRARTDLELAL